MRFKIYINYLQGNGVHAGVMTSDYTFYVRDVEPGVSVLLMGYIELSLNNDVPVSRDTITSLVREAYATNGIPTENSYHSSTNSNGRFEMLFRSGMPDSPDAVTEELLRYAAQAIDHGRTVRSLPHA